MKYLMILEDGSLRQSDDEPDEDTFAEIDNGTLDLVKFENGQFLYAEVSSAEGEDDPDETVYELKGWKLVQDA